ncbi:MAG: Rieske 2Fe-2S domain-containing protein [Pseudomonadota bacterium]|nr:Rieske 2Fe-2S domain-containing protein [Pseudomonadota bacterium]
MQIKPFSAHDMVDTTKGEISREIFVNKNIYEAEKEQIFTRSWLYIGHESQIKNPGDFFVSKMGEESVILTRDRAGEIHVFLNSCTHRGMKVCRYDEGNTKLFTCPYHAWSFSTDGKLIGVQDYENAYQPPFDKSEWGLIEVAQIGVYMGTIWATWDKTAPSFKDYLGDATFAFDHGLCSWDGTDGGTELLGSVQKWIVPCNWKFIAENFAGDALHVVSHRSVDVVRLGPSGEEGRRDDYGKLVLTAYPEGHGVFFGVVPTEQSRSEYTASKVTSEYFQHCWERRLKNLGALAGTWPVVGTIFPNMSFHAQQPRTLLVSHPRGANQTEMWRAYFVDKDAPEEVKQFLRDFYMRYAGPAGMTEQDDMENWNYATAASEGTIARRKPYHYKAGLGIGGKHEVVPGIVTEHPATSEQNPRMFYKRWAEYMDTGSWDELLDAQKSTPKVRA